MNVRIARRDKIYAVCFMTVFFFPMIWAVFFDVELWPWTGSFMYSYYIDENVARYRYRFVGVYEDDPTEREINYRDFNFVGWRIDYYFFGQVYGSIDPLSPSGKHPRETREKFEMRLSKFFRIYVKHLKKVNPTLGLELKKIRLDVVRLNTRTYVDQDANTVGYFEIASGRFFHTWTN